MTFARHSNSCSRAICVALRETTVTGNLFVPKTPEAFTYDADGNQTSDGHWTNRWDAENRLIEMETLSTVPTGAKLKLVFGYDAQGRRISKTVSNWVSSAWALVETKRFVYDGWNLVAVLNGSTLLQSFVWGTDLSGTMQGAGGVGGLIAFNDTTNTHFVAFDGNGNVRGLVKGSDGTNSATYEYGPFGELLRVTGTAAKLNPFRFSTKYTDDESDLVYYGYRSYNPNTGRWLSRDPIGEMGGKNLMAFINNDSANLIDNSGRAPMNGGIGGPQVIPLFVAPNRRTKNYNPFPKKFLDHYDKGCCSKGKIDQGLQDLKRRFGAGRDYLGSQGVQRDADSLGGGSASCAQGNTTILNFLGSLPKCWFCYIDIREDPYVPFKFPTWNENFIHCFALGNDGSKQEAIFDWFDQGTNNGVYEDVNSFYQRHPNAAEPPEAPVTGYPVNCQTRDTKWNPNLTIFNPLLRH